MTKDCILALTKDRLQKLTMNGKNIKSGGVVRKLRRKVRNLESK